MTVEPRSSVITPPEFSMIIEDCGGERIFERRQSTNYGVHVQPTIKDVLDFCQNKYARMRLFPATDEFVNRFNAHVAAIGRTVCHEQGVPFAVSNSLPDTTPLGTASAQLFTELQQMTHETPIDPAVVDDITESVM